MFLKEASKKRKSMKTRISGICTSGIYPMNHKTIVEEKLTLSEYVGHNTD